jgi:hypothetical protein
MPTATIVHRTDEAPGPRVPVTLVFGYLAFRASVARPTASVVHQKVA